MEKKDQRKIATMVEVEGRGFKPVFGSNSEKNFLGHGINTSAALIDFMVSEGGYTIEQIVFNIQAQCKDVKQGVSHTKSRVRSHLSWLKTKKGLDVRTDPKTGKIGIYKEPKEKAVKQVQADSTPEPLQ